MKYKSVFDIIGPIMIGPSSSHTAGAVKIGKLARHIFDDKFNELDIHFYGSFAQTYRGHATDIAVVGGLLGFEMDDERIKDSIEYAKKNNIVLRFFSETKTPSHPNTVKIVMRNDHTEMKIKGISIGGGAVNITEIEGFPINLSSENPAIIILHKDAYGAISDVSKILAQNEINIGHMEVSRSAKGENALMVIETDQVVNENLINDLLKARHVKKVKAISI